jgi:hypothetical protein
MSDLIAVVTVSTICHRRVTCLVNVSRVHTYLMSATGAYLLIRAAAGELQVNSRTLDHIVWRAASGREPVD